MKINLSPDRRMLRQFAWACLIALPLLAGYFAWKFELPLGWAIAIGALGLFVAFVQLVLVEFLEDKAGRALEKAIPRTVFQGLTLIAAPIGFVLSQVIMAAIFYLVITPIGLVFRLMGRDVIGKKPDPEQKTFWRDRGAPREPSSYFKLY